MRISKPATLMAFVYLLSGMPSVAQQSRDVRALNKLQLQNCQACPCGQTTRGRPYSAIEQITEIRMVNGRAQMKTAAMSFVGRDERGRSVVVVFGETGTAESKTAVPLSVMIYDPESHQRIHLNPRTKEAVVVKDLSLATSDERRSTPGSEMNAGVALEATQSLGSREINGLVACGVRKVFKARKENSVESDTVVSEEWWSRDLGAQLLFTHFDSRGGDEITELTNIVFRSPRANLFVIPPDYHQVSASDARGLRRSIP